MKNISMSIAVPVIAARATSFIFSKMILEYIDTFNLLAIRCLLAFAILAVLFLKD